MVGKCCDKCCKDCECKRLEIHLAWGGDVKDIKIKRSNEYEVKDELLSSNQAGSNLAQYLYDNTNYRFTKALTEKLVELDTLDND